MLKKYEAVFVLNERKSDDGGASFASEVEEKVKELGGNVVKADSIGRRQLAHPLRRQTAAHFWDFVIELAPDKVKALKDEFRRHAMVLRSLMFLYDRPPPKAKEEAPVEEEVQA